MLVERVLQKDPDVTIDRVASCILLASSNMLLTCPFSNCDDHVVLRCQGGIHVLYHILHVHLHLRNHAQVHEIGSCGGMHGHKARIATHELHNPDTLIATARLNERIPDDLRRLRHRRVKAEGAVEQNNIVVNGFWDAHDADRQLPLSRGFVEQVAGELRAVAADKEKHVDAQLLEVVTNLFGFEATPCCFDDAPTLHVDVPHALLCELDWRVGLRIAEAIVASSDSKNFPHSILIPETLRHAADDRVQAWAEPTTCHDRGLHLGWLPEDIPRCIGSQTAGVQERIGLLRIPCRIRDNVASDHLTRVEEAHVWESFRHGVADSVDRHLVQLAWLFSVPGGEVTSPQIRRVRHRHGHAKNYFKALTTRTL
mmetsp:Transcript_48943/g.109821  ORF Transcript_48943/g.109821 Transcript_48943/m.109821 type:complete len:369 (+) Transcript_48943:325-1431(+)